MQRQTNNNAIIQITVWRTVPMTNIMLPKSEGPTAATPANTQQTEMRRITRGQCETTRPIKFHVQMHGKTIAWNQSVLFISLTHSNSYIRRFKKNAKSMVWNKFAVETQWIALQLLIHPWCCCQFLRNQLDTNVNPNAMWDLWFWTYLLSKRNGFPWHHGSVRRLGMVVKSMISNVFAPTHLMNCDTAMTPHVDSRMVQHPCFVKLF